MMIIARAVVVFPRKNVTTHLQLLENVLRMKLSEVAILREDGVIRIQRSDIRKFIQIRSIHVLFDEATGEMVASNGVLSIEIIGTAGKWVDKMIDKILAILQNMGYSESHPEALEDDSDVWQYDDFGNFKNGEDDS